MSIEWKDTYSVGVNDIDEQHKRFFILLDKLSAIILHDGSQPELLQLLDDLIDYSKYHFDTEDELMIKHNYVNIGQHKLEHLYFSNKVLSYKSDMLKNNKYLSIEVFNFIRNWLVDHIIRTDMEMGKSIRLMEYI
jgi:hemerythrin-like metal-binding protein